MLRAVHTDALHTTYDGTSLGLSTRIGLGEYRVADPAGLIFNLEDKGSAAGRAARSAGVRLSGSAG